MKEIIIKDYPKSPIAEAIKTVKMNLYFSSLDKKNKTILITSSKANEGKSFIAANLAVSCASYEKKVLLIDCDLRRGRQNRIFSLSEKEGLSNLISDDDWEETMYSYLQKTKFENLDILSSGDFPKDSTSFLESSKLEKIINKLKSEYDLIILDSTYVNNLPDALILTRLSDDVLIVAHAKKTTIESLEETKKSLEKVKANIIGVILNHISIKK